MEELRFFGLFLLEAWGVIAIILICSLVASAIENIKIKNKRIEELENKVALFNNKMSDINEEIEKKINELENEKDD